MGFSQKRGRPRLNKDKKDLGTIELRNKKIYDITTEALDLCLKKSIITQEQHEAAMRLRWLYTLRFGAPDISAYNPENIGKSCFRQDNELWLSARHYEYKLALKELDRTRTKKIVMNICIFNIRPAFLNHKQTKIDIKIAKTNHDQLTKLCEGLELLSDLFGKQG